MQMQRTKDTAPEVALRTALHRRGLRFRLHQRVLPGWRRTVDVVFRPALVAVDVRGCFWHGCELHSRRGTANAEWWEHKLRTNMDRDAETVARLTEAGWLVFVVWEHDDTEEAAERIAEVVRARRATP
jgi:DNA mismatch endonuclease (patch repair protein)